MKTKERFRAVNGYEGVYSIGNNGTLLRRQGAGCRSTRRLNPVRNQDGYLQTRLSLNGDKRNVLVHRLVAEAFIPNPENKPQINHLDGDKTNNSVENLAWCTASENVEHLCDTLGDRVRRRGQNNPRAVLTEDDVRTIRKRARRRGKPGEDQRALAAEYGVTQSAIMGIVTRRTWKHVD